MSYRQPDLFYGDRQPPRNLKPTRAYRREERGKAKAFAWESMGAWVRHMHRLFAIESPSSDHYARTRETARCLTVERIRKCRHDDDLARCERMLIEARTGWLYGLDRAFSRAERGTLLVEVRNRRRLLGLGRHAPKSKGPRLDPVRLPDEALDRLIQSHADVALVEQLRHERERRLIERGSVGGIVRMEGFCCGGRQHELVTCNGSNWSSPSAGTSDRTGPEAS